MNTLLLVVTFLFAYSCTIPMQSHESQVSGIVAQLGGNKVHVLMFLFKSFYYRNSRSSLLFAPAVPIWKLFGILKKFHLLFLLQDRDQSSIANHK